MRLLLLELFAAFCLAISDASRTACVADGDHLLLKTIVRLEHGQLAYQTTEEAYDHVIFAKVQQVHPALTNLLDQICPNETKHVNLPAQEGNHHLAPFSWMSDAKLSGTLSVSTTLNEVIHDRDFQIFNLIKQGNFAAVLDMIEDGRGVNAVDEWGFTPLMRSIAVKQPVVISALLNSRRVKVDINKQRPSGHTALFYAAVFDHPSILRMLLKRGADPSGQLRAKGSRGSTPLHFACMFGLRKNAAILLEHGANPAARNEAGRTPQDLIDTSLTQSEIDAFTKLFTEAIQTWEQPQRHIIITKEEL